MLPSTKDNAIPTPLHIIVCIKAVITKAPRRGRTVRTPDNTRLNPFDLSALEAALQIREHRDGRVTALSMGPPAGTVVMAEALAMGADKAVLACDPAFAGADTLATATTLAAAVRALAPVDLLLFGTRTSDSDTGQVGPQTAEILGLPMVTGVHRFNVDGEVLRVERTMDHLMAAFSVGFPAALTLRPEAAAPRDMPLAGLAEAFDRHTVDSLTLDRLDVPAGHVGETGSPTRVISMTPVKHHRSGRMLAGTPLETADQLITCILEKGLAD